MREIRIKDLIAYRHKYDAGKRKFAKDLDFDIEKKNDDDDGGGNYWICCTSAIVNCFKNNNLQSIIDKIDELEYKLEQTDRESTKVMYKRNISILYNYEAFDFSNLKPISRLTFLKKHKDDSILNISGLQIKATPDSVFSFVSEKNNEIGAIWFIARLGGYDDDDLGMFTDILYRYLNQVYSKSHVINPKYCIAVDVVKNNIVNYSNIQKEDVIAILDSTIADVIKFRK